MSSVEAPELDSSYIEHLEKISTVWNNKKNLSSQELSGLTPFVNLYAILDANRTSQSSLLNQLDSDPIYFNKYDFKTNDIIEDGLVAIDIAKLQSQIAEFETDRNQKGGVGLTSLEVRRSTSEAFVVKFDLKLVITDSRLINDNILLSKLLTLNSLFVITFGWEGFEINNSEGINSVKRPIINRNNGKVELNLNKEDKSNGYWDWSAVKLYNFNFNVTQEGHLEVSLGFVSAETAHLQFGKTRNIANRVLSLIKRPDFEDNNITNSSVIGPIPGFESYFYDKPTAGRNISTDVVGNRGREGATNPGALLELWEEEWTSEFNEAVENPSARSGATKKIITGVEILYQDGEKVVRQRDGVRDIEGFNRSPWVYDEVNSGGQLVKTPRYAESGRGYFIRNLEIDLTDVKLVNSDAEAFFYNSTPGVFYANQKIDFVSENAANTAAINNPNSIRYSTSTPYNNDLLEKIKDENKRQGSRSARTSALRPVAITNLQYKKYTESIKQDIVFGKDIVESIFNLDENNEFFSINKDTIFRGNSITDSRSIARDKIKNGTIIFQSQSVNNNEGEESNDPAEPPSDVEQSNFNIGEVETRNLRIALVDLGEYINLNYGFTPNRSDYNTDEEYIDELLDWVYLGAGVEDPFEGLFNDYWLSVVTSFEFRFAKSVKIGIPTGSIIFQNDFIQNARDFTSRLATGAPVSSNSEAIDLGEEVQELYDLLGLSTFNAAAASEAIRINVSRRESIPTCYYLGAVLECIIKVVNDDFGEGSNKVRFLYQKVTESIKNEYAKIKFNVNRLQSNNKNIQVSISNIIETVFDLPIDYATVDNMLSNRNLNNSSINVLLKDILMAVNSGIMSSMPPLELSFRKRSDVGESVYEIYVLSQNIDGFNTQLINSYQAGRYVLNSTSSGSTIDLNFGEKNSLVQSFNVASKIDPLTYASFRMPTSFGLTSINLRGILNKIHDNAGERASFIETLLGKAAQGNGILFDNIVNTAGTGGVQDRIQAIRNYINSSDSEFTEETNNDITTLILGDPESFLSFIAESVVEGENGAVNPNMVSDLLLNFLLNIDATLHGITGVYLFDPIIVNNFVAQTGGVYIVNSVKETITPGDFKSVFNLKLHTPFDGVVISSSDVYVPPDPDAPPQRPNTTNWPSRQHPLNPLIVLYYNPTDTRPLAFKEYYDADGNVIYTDGGRIFFNTDEDYDQAIESFRQSNSVG